MIQAVSVSWSMLEKLFQEVGEWSERTFGTIEERGPIGPLRHAIKEIREELLGPDCDPANVDELADVLILFCDATRRAGVTIADLRNYGTRKQLYGMAITIETHLKFAAGVETSKAKQVEHLDALPPARSGVDGVWLYGLLLLYSWLLEAAGLTWPEIIEAGHRKMEKNRSRVYAKPVGDEISEHDRSQD